MNRDADDSGFCESIGVFGAEPRLHAFSYDVSVRKERERKKIMSLSFSLLLRPPRVEISLEKNKINSSIFQQVAT